MLIELEIVYNQFIFGRSFYKVKKNDTLVAEMVKCRKDVGDRRTNREMRAYAGASHDAGDRAAVSARFHIAAAERIGIIGIGLFGAEGSPEGGTDLPKLAIPSRRQSTLEREVQGSWYRGSEGSTAAEAKELPKRQP